MTANPAASDPLSSVLQIRILSALGLLICLVGLSRTVRQGPPTSPPADHDQERIVWATGLPGGEGFYRIDGLTEHSVLPPPSLVGVPAFASLSFTAGSEPVVKGIHPRTALLFFQPIPLNLADAQVLAALPNIGPALSGRILAKRQELGGFKSLEQLLQVRGIGPKTYEHLKSRLALNRGLNL